MKRIPLSIFIIAILLIAASMLMSTPTAQAQRPTPTTIPTATPTPAATSAPATVSQPVVAPKTGVVSGYVVDYTGGGAPQAGIPVVLDGGGWSLEAMSDSNGFFQFMGLGDGTARLRLKLPPDAHPVNEDWQVNTAGETVNMGFRWGDAPLPVVLMIDSTEMTARAGEATSFSVMVKNQSGGEATNITLKVVLPDGVTPTTAEASTGTAEVSENTVLGTIDTLPTGETATFTIAATAGDGLGDTTLTGEVTLMYDQQYSPQRLAVTWQPASGSAGTAATDGANALIPTTGDDTDMSTNVLPLILLSLAFIVGLGYAGMRTMTRRTE